MSISSYGLILLLFFLLFGIGRGCMLLHFVYWFWLDVFTPHFALSCTFFRGSPIFASRYGSFFVGCFGSLVACCMGIMFESPDQVGSQKCEIAEFRVLFEFMVSDLYHLGVV